MSETAFLPTKARAALSAFLESDHTKAVMADPEFKRGLAEVTREVSELAATRKQAREIRSEVMHQPVAI
jgi:hypothetical protein